MPDLVLRVLNTSPHLILTEILEVWFLSKELKKKKQKSPAGKLLEQVHREMRKWNSYGDCIKMVQLTIYQWEDLGNI